MKPYETGICKWCKGTKEMHNENNPCATFLDSGTAHLRDKTEVMFEALEEIKEEAEIQGNFTISDMAQEAINEALKR